MDVIIFKINGKKYSIGADLSPFTSLNDYIRNHAMLKGTKTMCNEGGCGACTVSVSVKHPLTKERQIFSVNSCLVSVFSCHEWLITTIEGLGRRDDYHEIQRRLAGFNGSQCGYCSPGWVMSMHSIRQNSPGITMEDIENSFAGNICRCTGYRPIMDAFKSFSSDCDKNILERVHDIEDITGIKMCYKTGKACGKIENGFSRDCDSFADENNIILINKKRQKSAKSNVIKLQLNGLKWYKVNSTEEVFDIWEKKDKYCNIALVAGNTAKGVYPLEESPNIMIDISSIAELKSFSVGSQVIVGAGLSLNEAMAIFKNVASKDRTFKYLQQFYNHLDLVAHVSVRNMGTIAGNLAIKHAHPDFASDIFVLLESVGATIKLHSREEIIDVTLADFLKSDMKRKLILCVNLPPLDFNSKFYSYKIMPRSQNSHAHVNAGFCVKLNKETSKIEKASIVYGGIHSNFIHAEKTEKFLIGKVIFEDEVLKAALSQLSNELKPEDYPAEPSPEYRKRLAIGLFYKYILRIAPSGNINQRKRSGGEVFSRPISSARQTYNMDRNLWPLNKPVSKLESLVQCAGEAEYVNDLPHSHREVHLAFVLSTVFNGSIDKFYPDEALKQDGVYAFLTSKDIPGDNNFCVLALEEKEEILASDNIKYHGQPIGLIAAASPELAQKAAKLVRVTYKNVRKTSPVLTAREAIKSKYKVVNKCKIEPADKGNDIVKVLKGSYEIFGQYHYTMEPQTCVCVPTEDGLNVFSATQWIAGVQTAIASCLNINQSKINVEVRRLGGAYGGKISRPSLVACATALAAYLLKRPARLVMPLTDMMRVIGKRIPCTSDYEIAVNDKGRIQYLENTYYNDNGCTYNESITEITLAYIFNCYNNSRWYISGNGVLTDTPSNTWCRAPGSLEGIAMTENIMEHIAVEMGLDPLEVRLANMAEIENPVPELIKLFKEDTDYENRKIAVIKFNTENRWKKRGISLVPMTYPVHNLGVFTASVSIYCVDGTVSICHGGIEMGQGLNTKVAQVCAHVLGIPMDHVSIKPANSHVSANNFPTGGSIGSEKCCEAVIKACQVLLGRLEPIRQGMENPTWKQLINKASESNIVLTESQTVAPAPGFHMAYNVYGVTITEVEVDILTGNHNILRADLLVDTGQCISPDVDVGQVEGAFIMGLGYWTSESLVYDKATGELLTNRTWNYKPPGVKDIPIDFRVQLRRNDDNPNCVLRSKATGEPPLCMAVGVTHAIRQAITSARQDAGIRSTDWYNITLPCNPENVLLAVNNEIRNFTLQN